MGAIMAIQDISQIQDGGVTYDQYGNPVNTATAASSYAGPSVSLNLNSGTPYKRPDGIPAYSGYQPPDYGNTTPNNTHWLNTMNAYAPNARTDMSRLLGQGGAAGSSGSPLGGAGSSGGMGSAGGMGAAASAAYQSAGGILQPPSAPYQKPGIPTTGGMSAGSVMGTGLLGGPTQPATTQPAPTNPFPTEWTQNSAPGYMDAFYNTAGSAYLPPTQTTQNAYTQPATNNYSTGTVGINPTTGALTFL